jgi:serine/threonine protein kinase
MSINIIEYWFTSLIDSDRISESEKILEDPKKYVESHRQDLADGLLSELDNGKLSKLFELDKNARRSQKQQKQPNLDGDIDEPNDDKVLICPLLLVLKDKPTLKGSLVPLWIPAKVSLTGKLSPDPDGLPWLSRQLLSPQDSEQAIGDVEIFNRFLCDRACPTENWADYWQFCNELLATVAGMDLAEFNLPTFSVRSTGAILPNTLVSGTTAAVKRVYTHLLRYRKKLTPLLAKLTLLTDRPIDPLLTAVEQHQQSRKHLGQMTGDYPLSISQRESLYHFFKLGRGEILAINGPPGTGKTTLLQSVISSLWVEKAVAGGDPPIIVASSANNQAITNIIDSFGAIGKSDDLLSQRWLPQLSSYGLYLASKSKFQAQQNTDWQMLTPERQGFMAQMESAEQIVAALHHFRQKCQEFFQQPISTLAAALGLLRNSLQATVAQIHQQLDPLDPQHSNGVQSDLDCQHRYRAFQLATHYWEGRWLQDCEDLAQEDAPDSLQQSDWYRYAKLTPCFVATFFMVPKFFRSYKSGYDTPMWDFIDLLIVDEAGQVSPEIAGASFALAKKALVVGDTLQIEPVWSIPQAVDNGNLLRHKLGIDPDQFGKLGLSAANGSVMILAQRASRYQKFAEQRGMFLSEHRRCLDEIISYCNQLCYHGKLEPMRGSLSPASFIPSAEGFSLPPMGYLHIAGKSEQFGSSRRNQIEAQTIARWIAFQAGALSQHYNRPLSEIVGVVTPFKQQSNAISHSLAELGIRDVTVGTVHALQGAERAIVIFSPVYDPQQAQTFFFDRQPNMLNVAVSRAKDSFLVFGDRRIFKVDESIPSGLLAKFLFASEANALPKLPLNESVPTIVTPVPVTPPALPTTINGDEVKLPPQAMERGLVVGQLIQDRYRIVRQLGKGGFGETYEIIQDRYRIVRQLGKGGFGETYEIEHLNVPTSVKPRRVLKYSQLYPHQSDYQKRLELFEREAKALYELGAEHDRIPVLYEYFQVEHQLFLIQQLVVGRDLSQEIGQGTLWTETQVLEFLPEILEILAFIHSRRIIHRDIKPSNIMRRESDHKLVLIDFGIIKEVVSPSTTAEPTVAAYTDGFTAPEQYRGRPQLNSDLYALGCLVILALTGQLATHFMDDNSQINWRSAVQVSDELATIIDRTICRRPSDRYLDASEALAAVRALISQRQVNVNLNPVDVHLNKIELYRQQKQIELAIVECGLLIAIDPNSAIGYSHRSFLHNQSRNYQQAIIDATACIKIDSTYYPAYYSRACAYLTLADYQQAIIDYGMTIDLNSQYSKAYQYRAIAFRKIGQLEAAKRDEEMFEKLS